MPRLNEYDPLILKLMVDLLERSLHADLNLLDIARDETFNNEQRVAALQFWAGKTEAVRILRNAIKKE